jgi:hypothetical protein
MQRGSDRLSRHRDDEMKHELQGLLRSGHPTRSAEWNDPEPTADDDPQVWPDRPGASLEGVRLELARILGRSSFPATSVELGRTLRRKHAPDPLVEAVEALPRKENYATVQELARALTRTEGAP